MPENSKETPQTLEMTLNILQINTYDQGGGAEKIALTLNDAFNSAGHNSVLLVKKKLTACEQVSQFRRLSYGSAYYKLWSAIAERNERYVGKIKGFGKLREAIDLMTRPKAAINRRLGREDFDHIASRHILEQVDFQPDVIQCHNLHGGYFDLRVLQTISQPLFVTLHDEWLMTGHCACTIGCERWRNGCGHCPDLTIPPVIKRDATDNNWQTRRSIYEHSHMHICAPSQWLCDRARQSTLALASSDIRVINNGVELDIFHPSNKQELRHQFDVPKDAFVLLFTANRARSNPFKDYETLRNAVIEVANRISDRHIVFFALGEVADTEHIGRAEIRHVPYKKDPVEIAEYYQVADIYLHAARADNFPTTILEALACGVPVIATAVGGIPEQVDNGETGFLVPMSDVCAFADSIVRLVQDKSKLNAMSKAALKSAQSKFDYRMMVDSYLKWYEDVLCENSEVSRHA